MTELERQLMKALKELSAQYAREQQLDARVAALAADYKRIADALSRRWK